MGDALARILSAQGADVTKEYYFNDHGGQIDRFSRSLVAAHEGRPTPEDGYGGAYIDDIARRVALAYDGDLDAPTVVEAWRAATTLTGSPDLSRRDWADAGRAHADAFRAAVRVKRRGAKH